MKNENEIIIAKEILCISFNQDYSCMAAGTEKGFMIFNTNPFKKKFSRSVKPYEHYRFSWWGKKRTFSKKSSDHLG